MFGASHLLVHFYLAAALEPARYGAFALAMVWGLLAAGVHQAFLVEPLLVARSAPVGSEPGYLRAVLGLHWRLTLAGSLLMGAAAGVPSSIRGEIAGAAVFVLGVTLVRLTRGMAYAELPAHAGTLAVGGYAALSAFGLGAFGYFDAISGPAALGVMGVAGTLAGSVALLRERLPRPAPGLAGRVLAYHWQHGRWLLLLSPFRWALDSLPLVVLGHARGLTDVAQLRAAVLVVAPAVQVVGAVRLMLIPRFAEAMRSCRLRPLLWRAELALVACAGAFALLVSLEAAPLLALVAPKYAAAERLLPLVSLTPLLLGSALVFGNVLRAAERPDLSARAFVLASVTASATALLWCEHAGAWGAALALASGYATLLASKATLAFRAVRSRRSSA